MYIYDIIEKKRLKKELTKEEIEFVVNSFVAGKIEDSQMSSLLMAIVLNGMTYDEILNLTLAMRDSGNVLKFDEFIVDKHSTGGVSDSTTLILVPLLAHLGIKTAKMSGRSLGFTGGTIDKVEVFDGYVANKSLKEFKQILNSINCSIISQTDNMAVADKLIYSLRSKTATVDSIPLIASSIMSKKLAMGSSFLLLNVQVGSGAFMKNEKDAINLAKIMVKIGNDSGVKTCALVSNMNTPLSSGIGSSLEVKSVIDALNGENTRLLQLSKALANVILTSVKNISTDEANLQIESALKEQAVKNKLKELIKAHGGNDSLVDNPKNIKKSKFVVKILAKESGYVNKIDAYKIAKLVNHIQAETEQEFKNFVGCKLLVDINSFVNQNDAVAELHLNSKKHVDELTQEFFEAVSFGKRKVKPEKLIIKIIK